MVEETVEAIVKRAVIEERTPDKSRDHEIQGGKALKYKTFLDLSYTPDFDNSQHRLLVLRAYGV
mgnify:CR=1 FL=1